MKDWKEKLATIRHYDRQATIYDVQYRGEQKSKIEDILKNIELSANEQILDLGCGTGFLFQHISQKVGFLVGVDISLNTLQVAKKRMKNRSNIALIRADADNTPFFDSVFDKIFAITVLQNMPNPVKTIKEMKRTGKKEALFAVTGLKKKYTQKSFVNTFEKANLKVVSLNSSQQLKGYVALCRNM